MRNLRTFSTRWRALSLATTSDVDIAPREVRAARHRAAEDVVLIGIAVGNGSGDGLEGDA